MKWLLSLNREDDILGRRPSHHSERSRFKFQLTLALSREVNLVLVEDGADLLKKFEDLGFLRSSFCGHIKLYAGH
jgi:hypothetical protein